MAPTVSSVTPTFGPMAGGTTVVVRGTALNVGNQEDTRVSLEIKLRLQNIVSDTIK